MKHTDCETGLADSLRATLSAGAALGSAWAVVRLVESLSVPLGAWRVVLFAGVLTLEFSLLMRCIYRVMLPYYLIVEIPDSRSEVLAGRFPERKLP